MEVLIGLVTFAIALVVAYLIYLRQKKQGDEAKDSIAKRLVEEGHATRARLVNLERRLKDVLNTNSITDETREKIDEVFSDAEFVDILAAIDPEGNLKDGSDINVKELTKRMMFFVINDLFYFPYNKYRDFILWLRTKGYGIPDKLTFDSYKAYEAALTKVERLNRVGVSCGDVDVSKLFSDKS